jgi:cell division protein FtsI (penicillin-binding protein 3)
MRASGKTRILVVGTLFGLIFTSFSAKLVDIQVAKHEDFSAKAANKHSTRIVLHARRGRILDRNGELLASNLPVRNVIIDASHVTDADAVASITARHLGLEKDEILRKIETGRKYIVIKRKIPEETGIALRRDLREQKLRGVTLERDTVRVYPNGQTLCHVLGFLDHEGKGIQGIERTLDNDLAGMDGHRHITYDRKGREIMLYRGLEVQPVHGADVRLTIDMGLQAIVEDELDKAWEDLTPEKITVVLKDPRTGEILAMANRPNFDPNEHGKFPQENKKNRAVIDMFEPGSTFKIVVAAAALNEGKVDSETTIFCENGRFAYGGRILRDHRPHGDLDLRTVMIKSSNIGCAKMALMLGDELFHDYVRRFGFGERLGIELPGEIRGMVNHPTRWDKLTITRMPMGQAVAATPLQIVSAMSVIANGGDLVQPRLVKSVEPGNGMPTEVRETRVLRRVVPKEVAAQVGDALVGVTADGGTATYARVNGFQVAGKTGTAQKASPRGGYAPGKYVVSFAGYMPADEPRFACLVLVDDADRPSHLNYGGLVAAPIFASISERAARYLDLIPTLPAIPLQATADIAGE